MEIFDLPATSPHLQAILQSALPYSIALVYRTQHRNRSKYAKILTTFPSSTRLDSIPKCWAVAYFDRSMRPETELWIFAAGELPGHHETGFCLGCKKAVLSLLKHLAGIPIPPLRPDNQYALDMAYQHEKDYPEPQANGTYPPSPGTYMRHMLCPEVVLLGACHEDVVQTCRDYGLVRREFLGSDADLHKFIFQISDLPKTRDLPKGLRWGEMREQDIDLVRSRTSIPRTPKTLLSLKSVGVFDEASDKAVAWTYLGLDGSLTTLHTEEQYRGKGIAKAVAARIITEHAPGIAVDQAGNAWSHADVYAGNIQSEAVCRSLGGKALWRNYWVKIDLGKARALGEQTRSSMVFPESEI